MPIVKFNAGDTILSEGDKGETAFLILEGSVEVAVGAGDKARVVGKLDAGEVFGEMSLIDAGPRSATIRAAGDTTCLETSFDGFLELVAENPKEAATILKTLVRRLRQMNELVARMDSENRSIREIARDWRGSIESGDVSDDERDRALIYLAESVPPENPDEEAPDERERDIFSGWT